MNKIILLVCTIAILVVSAFANPSLSSSSSSSPLPTPISLGYNIYSVSTSSFTNEKQLMVIDPWNYDVLYNITLERFNYDVVDILSLDISTNTLLLLCSDSSKQILATITTSSTDYVQLSVVEMEYDFTYAIQDYIFIEDQKTATIPAQVNVNGTYYNFLMETDFGTEKLNLLNLSTGAPYTIQGYDYINQIDYIAYINFNDSFHLMSFDYSTPSTTIKYYYNIQNIVMVNYVFTDPSGNLYFINQQYENATTPSGYYDIRKFNLDQQNPSCSDPLFTIYLGNELSYTYIPYIVSQDRNTFLFIVNQAPGISGYTLEFELTFISLNDNLKVTTISIPNDDPTNTDFSARNFKI